MFSLFEPKTKVQKDRGTIRDTDTRLVKYSRRGLITHFLVYIITVVFGQTFASQNESLAIFLTVGLLITTFARGYLLFRFDALYPRGPTAWRNRFFTLSLIAAAWWSLILSCVTLTTGISGEALLLWLYTIVFFSSTSNAFAPYAKFLTIYQYLGMLPAAVSVFFIGDYSAILFGGILLFFVWILNHQSEMVSKNYWDNLDAQYILAKKTQSIEEEKRDTRASVQLTNDYLNVLNAKLKSLLSDKGSTDSDAAIATQPFEQVSANVDQFYRILNKEVEIDNHIFNVRHYIQSCVAEYVEVAENKGIFIETALSPALPMRLTGDAMRFGQILKIMFEATVEQTQNRTLIIEIEFIREYEKTGELHVSILQQGKEAKKKFFAEQDRTSLVVGMELTLAKAMADTLGGALEIGETKHEDQTLNLRVPMELAEPNAKLEYHRLDYKAKNLILVHKNGRWLDQKRMELDALGFEVSITNEYKTAFNKLLERSGNQACTVVFSHSPDDDASLQFSQDLLNHEQLKYTNQFIICSRQARRQAMQLLPKEAEATVRFLPRPAGIFEFDTALLPLFGQSIDQIDKTEIEQLFNPILWLNTNKDFKNADRVIAMGLTVHKAQDIKALSKNLQHKEVGLVVCEDTGLQAGDCVRVVRDFEREHVDRELMPIVAVDEVALRETLYFAGIDHFYDTRHFLPEGLTALQACARGRFH